METVARNASNLRVRWIAVPSARWDSGKSFKATAILENTAITCSGSACGVSPTEMAIIAGSIPIPNPFSPLANLSDVIDGSRRQLATLYDVLRGVHAYDSSTCDCRA
jgi:hypothetical protein